jgi:hypothetical protein
LFDYFIGWCILGVPERLPWMSGYTPNMEADETKLNDFEGWRGRAVDNTALYLGHSYFDRGKCDTGNRFG